MSEYMVDVGLNVQPGQYMTTMGQAIAVTQEYAKVVDGVPGSIAKMSAGLVNLTNKITGFSAVNTMAVDSAAAYQKALSGIEAQAAASGKSFTSLEKTTKQFARGFSGGLGQAVQVVETLQKQGVKSEKQIETLGKAWIKLGAATGTSAAAMGAEFTQLNRTMGHGVANFTKLSDSLVTVTSKIGGSADSVVAFSKAMAPVAATVGMNQTAVMGLSAAMSSLGEDGYRSANVLNKVMLDMNRVLRDGGPELKAYADLMGMTGDKMKSLLKSDPTEFFTRFTESLSKAGPELSRSLEALGFDSVRDTRALAALTRSGNLRGAIQTAREGFGDGSTERAAAKALEGVTDQAEKLKESMSQVVANVGKPLLGVVQGQLGIANNIAGGAASLSEGQVPQIVSGVAGIGGAVGSVGANALTLASGIALSRIGMRKLGESAFAQQAMAGFQAGRSGETLGRAATPLGRAGQALGQGVGGAFMMPNAEPMTRMDALMMASRRTASVGADVAARGIQGLYGNLFRSAEGLEPLRSAGGQAYREQLGEARSMLRQGQLGSASSQFLRATGGYFGGLGQAGSAMGLGQAVGSTALGAGKMLGGAAGTVGMGALRMGGAFLGSPMGALAMGGGALMYLNQGREESNQRAYEVRDSNLDINSSYNAFAEAAGLATKGLTSFNSQVVANSKVLADQNSSMEKALSLSSEEIGNATSAGYKPAYELLGEDKSVAGIAAQGQSLLGARPSSQAVAAFLSDVVNQAGEQTAKGVAESFKTTYGSGTTARLDYGAMTKSLIANNPSAGAFWNMAGGMNDTQKQLAMASGQAVMGLANMDRQAFGGTMTFTQGDRTLQADAGTARALAEAERMYTEAQKAGAGQGRSPQERMASASAVNAQIQAILGKEFENYGFSLDGAPSSMGLQQGQSFDELMKGAAAQGNGQAAVFLALKQSGTIGANGSVDLSKFRGESGTNEKNAKQVDREFSALAKTAAGLSDTLYGAEKSARDFGVSMDDLSAKGAPGMSGASRSVFGFEMGGNERQKRMAAESILSDALQKSGGDQGMAAAALQLQRSQAGLDTRKQEAIDLALQLQEPRRAFANAGRTAVGDRMSAMRSASVVGAMQFSNTDTGLNDLISGAQDQVYGLGAEAINAAVGFNMGYGALQTQIASTRRSAGINIGSISRDTALNERYANEDFERQQRLGKRDFNITRQRANRDFGIQTVRAGADFERQNRYAGEDMQLQQFRAKRDFDKQMLHAEQDYQKARGRAIEDNNTAVYRAQRDFDKQMGRAQRDFDKSQERGLEDYNRTRMRAVEDFNKQMSRMVEDATKQMYDPWKRISAQMVMDAGQLVTNLKDQTAAIDKQVANLAEARSMGLSEQAIKALNLSDANNAQQLSRIVEDMRGNRDFTSQINQAVSAKASSSETLVKDQGNTAFSRAQEDFATSLDRMKQDYDTTKARAEADFATSKSDTTSDFSTSMADAAADFNKSIARMDADYNTSTTRAKDAFNVSLADMIQSFEISRTRSKEQFETQMQYAKEDHARMLSDMKKDFDKANNDAKDSLDISITRMWEKARNAMSDVGAQAGAAIQSMMEQFFKVGQTSPTGPGAFKTLLQNVMGSGIDPRSMGKEVQDQIQEALNFIETNNIKVPDNLKKWFAGRGFTGEANPQLSQSVAKPGDPGFIGPVYDPEYKPKQAWDPKEWLKDQPVMKPVTVDVPVQPKIHALQNLFDPQFWTQVADAGKNVWNGFLEGLTTAFTAVSPFDWLDNFISGVLGKLEIQSPSKVFMRIGQNVVFGLRDGILGAISGVWEMITDPIKDLKIGDKVEGAFNSAKTWLGNLGSKITTWISDGWNSLWDKLESIDMGKKVETVFGSVKTWLGNLATNLGEWISEGWKGLWSKMPTADDLKTEVKKVFMGEDGNGGIKGWLGGLVTTIKGWLPNAKDLKEMFSNGLVKPFAAVVDWLIGKWNDFAIPAFKVERSFAAPKNLVNYLNPLSEDFMKTENKTVTFIDTPRIDFPNIGFGKDNAESLTSIIPFALGGIATRQTNALIGEAGYPEAVIPLNQRGAEVLAATMARYVGKSEAQGAMVSQYATPVVNNYAQTYDQRTQFTGPITVESQNPDDMAQKLQARARRQRLAQPIGSA